MDDFGFLWVDISTTPESAYLKRSQKRHSVLGKNEPKASARKKSEVSILNRILREEFLPTTSEEA